MFVEWAVYLSLALATDQEAVPGFTELRPAEAWWALEVPPNLPTLLSAQDISQAGYIDALSIPSPPEMFRALTRFGSPVWREHYRPPISTSFISRSQIAINLGTLLADCYLAVQAKDDQQVRNLMQDVLALASALGMQDNLRWREHHLLELASAGRWRTLCEELEATQNEIKLAMISQRDNALIVLLSIGSWVRSLQVFSAVVEASYTPEKTAIFRQPMLARFMEMRVQELPPPLQGERVVKQLRKSLPDICSMLSLGAGEQLSQSHINQLNRYLDRLIRKISKK